MNEPINGCFNCAFAKASIHEEPCRSCGPRNENWVGDSNENRVGDSHEALTFGPIEDTKLTNPKDIVGTRKAPMSTVPANVLAELGVAMLEGASKYGRHNYRVAGVRGSVYYDGVLRHMMAWWEGEDIDPDSGVSHITKAIASLVVLRDAMMQSMWTDDRPPRSVQFYPTLNEQAGAVIDRYADRNPRHYTIADGKEAA